MSTLTGCPVRLATFIRTLTLLRDNDGYTCRSSNRSSPSDAPPGGGSQRSSICPTIPFQFPCVWSVMQCELTPTSTIRLLSTRIVS